MEKARFNLTRGLHQKADVMFWQMQQEVWGIV
jgi:hypothetical protein